MSSEDWQRQAVLGHAEDLDLIRKLRDGNSDGLTLLFEKYSGIVFSIARRMLPNDAEAEEVVHQAFLDTFRALDQFDANKMSYRTWLLQFAIRHTISRKRLLDGETQGSRLRMTTSSGRKHAGPRPVSGQPPLPEPTLAERARTLAYLGRLGSLSTLSSKQPGFPFGSLMPYGLDDHGRAIFLISTMAMHTRNLQADVRASLLVTQEDTDGEPLGASRVTLVGNVLSVPNIELAEVRKLYLERHANSKYWVDFEDFSFYRMDVVDVYYVGGFGVMGWVSASDYDRSQPDPLADSMAEIIQYMNTDHRDALVLLARQFAHVDSTEATMTAVDRLGFHVRLKTAEGTRGARIAFLREVSNQGETRKVFGEMVQEARSQAK